MNVREQIQRKVFVPFIHNEQRRIKVAYFLERERSIVVTTSKKIKGGHSYGIIW